MPYIQLEDHYSVYDILECFSHSEYDMLLEHIVESGDLIRPNTNDTTNPIGSEFAEALDKLYEHRLELSLEDEKTILEIANKV